MKFNLEYITPELAKRYLEQNTNNYRTINNNLVRIYANDMANGKWESNCEPIQFSKNGVLLNGQHRLSAIVLSGKTIPMLIIRDIEDSVSLFDINKVRSAYDIAKNNGLSANACQHSSLAAASIILSEGFRAGRSKQSKKDIVDFAKSINDYLDLAYKIVCHRNSKDHLCRRGIVIAGVVMFLYKKLFPVDILYDFFGVVNTGFHDEKRESSAAIVFRNYMLSVTSITVDVNREIFSTMYDAVTDFMIGRRRNRKYTVKEYNESFFRQTCAEIKDEYLTR